jgi:hypothetical protein
MKKAVILASAALLITSAALAETNVLSQNAVGYIRKSTAEGNWNLIGMQFDTLDGETIVIGDVLGTNGVPNNTKVFIYDKIGATYLSETYYDGFGWHPGTNAIERGDGVWVKTPASHDFFVMGEVPSAATNNFSLVGGFQIITYPYPVERALTNSILNDIAENNDKLYTFDGTNYTTYTYYDGFGWNPNDLIFEPGMAFWYRSGSGASWSEPKPYRWP